MVLMVDNGATTGVRIRRDLGQVESVLHFENGDHVYSPMVEQYVIEDIGGGQEAFASATRNAFEALTHAMWFRTGMSVNENHTRAVVSGTNSLFYDMPDLSGAVTISFTAEGSVV